MANPTDSLTFVHIGPSSSAGVYSVVDGIHRISGVGADVFGKSDDFDYACTRLKGDFQITARIRSVEYSTDSTKAGIMIRQDLAAGSRFAFALTSSKYRAFLFRLAYRNNCKYYKYSSAPLPSWLRVIRCGNRFINQRSVNGIEWYTVGIKTIEMPDSVYYGLAVASNMNESTVKAVFDSVRIECFDQPLTKEIQTAILRTHVIPSVNVRDSFKIVVGLPISYDSTEATTYPVAYHLDGGNEGEHYILRSFEIDRLAPECISVGIGYTGATQRERDYTTGFSDFYRFMVYELIPFIDKTYKTNPANRTLFGHSLGGYCAFQTLLMYGNAMPFQNIIAASPSLYWPDGVFTYDCEQHFFEHSKILPVNFYMTMGSEELYNMIPDFQRMSAILVERKYEHFNFKNALNAGQTHGKNNEFSFIDGHLWILNQPLPPVLEQIPWANTFNIFPNEAENDQIVIYPNPARISITIDCSKIDSDGTSLEIVSLLGRLMYKTRLYASSTINVSGFPYGMYLVKLMNGNQTKGKFVVVQ
jgi:predicted alpha/beta superfamily hydrolase